MPKQTITTAGRTTLREQLAAALGGVLATVSADDDLTHALAYEQADAIQSIIVQYVLDRDRRNLSLVVREEHDRLRSQIEALPPTDRAVIAGRVVRDYVSREDVLGLLGEASDQKERAGE